MDPTFGITFTEMDDEPRAVIASDLSTALVVGTAPDADDVAFPLDTAVLVRTSDSVLRAKLGLTGTIPDAIKGIHDQLGTFQAAADVMVIRVEQGADEWETIANILGDQAAQTGMWAALLAGPDLARIPRLLCFPGFTHQRPYGVSAINVTAGGTGYTSAPTVVLTGGGGTGAAAHAVLGSGANEGKVVSVVMDNEGIGYTSAPAISFTGGAGTGAAATAVRSKLANPICAGATPLLNMLFAHAVVEGPGTNEADIKDWRESFNSRRLIPVDLWCKVQEGSSVVTRPGAPRVIGLGITVDYQHGGVPTHSWANRPIQGIVGFVRNPSFSLTDGATEGQSLLSANIGIGVRGELGVETAIASSGFIFVGTDNADDDPLWQFYHVSRGRDYIRLGLLRTLRAFLGRNNITGHAIQAVLNTTTQWLMDLQSDDHIIGSRVGFAADKNSPENLRLGRFSYQFRAEEPPVLRRLDIEDGRYREALEDLVENILTTVQPATTAVAA